PVSAPATVRDVPAIAAERGEEVVAGQGHAGRIAGGYIVVPNPHFLQEQDIGSTQRVEDVGELPAVQVRSEAAHVEGHQREGLGRALHAKTGSTVWATQENARRREKSTGHWCARSRMR